MHVSLKYGNIQEQFNIPEVADILNISEPAYTVDKEQFEHDLRIALEQLNYTFDKIGIVVSDKTRLCGYEQFLPWLTDLLESLGAQKENISFYIAYGTHPKQSDEESLASYGDIFNKYTFIHHDCANENTLKKIGATTRGTPITIHKEIFESSLIITFGAISHHYFAGFGGGRKLLFPGLAGKEAIYHNHSLFLDFTNRKLQDGCQPGNLNGNPLAEDLKEIDALLPEKISIHGILDSHGKVNQLTIGTAYQDFLSACDIHDSCYKSKRKEVYDMVIASAGGYPKDINFIQSHKSIHNAAAFVKDGGTLILLAECRDGTGGNTLMPLFELQNRDKIFKVLAEKYIGNGGTVLAMLQKANRINIQLISSFNEHTSHLLGTKKADITSAQQLINAEKGNIAVIQNASMLIP